MASQYYKKSQRQINKAIPFYLVLRLKKQMARTNNHTAMALKDCFKALSTPRVRREEKYLVRKITKNVHFSWKVFRSFFPDVPTYVGCLFFFGQDRCLQVFALILTFSTLSKGSFFSEWRYSKIMQRCATNLYDVKGAQKHFFLSFLNARLTTAETLRLSQTPANYLSSFVAKMLLEMELMYDVIVQLWG